MTISKRDVKARRTHGCAECHKDIPKGTVYLRLFGRAEVGDKPFVIRLCPRCRLPNEMRQRFDESQKTGSTITP